jgi:hypothetical protein
MNTSVIILVTVSVIFVLSMLKKLAGQKAQEVLKKFEGRKVYGVHSSANYFGQESLGMGQARGNGVLVLAEGELYFQMWAPKKEISIKFSDITGVETPKSHLGKTKGRKLLKVLFKNEQGQADSAA